MFKDAQSHPFYKPLWRRIVIVAVTASWFAMEVWAKDGMWMPISGAFFGFSLWAFLITYPKTPEA